MPGLYDCLSGAVRSVLPGALAENAGLVSALTTSGQRDILLALRGD